MQGLRVTQMIEPLVAASGIVIVVHPKGSRTQIIGL